jgi:sigma-B regulation protein RsbU (phosphoserine phosphatase)
MNEELARDNERMMFVTAAIGCLDFRSGAVALVDAGHMPPLLADRSGVREWPHLPKGMALGVMPDAAYVAADLPVRGGATLVLYTDGFTDARAGGGDLFGERRLRDAIAAADAAPDAIVASVVDIIERFAAGAPPEDDQAMLALRLKG